jgi:1,4-alpha-glucan branching enzyme
MVIANFGNRGYESYTVDSESRFLEAALQQRWKGYSVLFGDHFSYDTVAFDGAKDNMPCYGNVGLGPYTAIILSQENS